MPTWAKIVGSVVVLGVGLVLVLTDTSKEVGIGLILAGAVGLGVSPGFAQKS